jgi:SulP family sulfate permease
MADFETFRLLLAPAFIIAMLGAVESLLSVMVADGATSTDPILNLSGRVLPTYSPQLLVVFRPQVPLHAQ